jgi:PilZ domain-containing protein
MPKEYPVKRAETRIPMAVGVHISGHARVPGTEDTFTEDVSSRGARVGTVRRWQRNDRLKLVSLPGDFKATARVAYCLSAPGQGFVIGLEFLEPVGEWIVPPAGPK